MKNFGFVRVAFVLFALLAVASVSYGQCGSGSCSASARRSMMMQPTMMSGGSSWGSSAVPVAPTGPSEVEIIALKAVNGERARAAIKPVEISKTLADEARSIAFHVSHGMDGKKIVDSSPYTVVIAKGNDLGAIKAVQAWSKNDKSSHAVLAPDANVCGYAFNNGVAVLLMGVQK